MSVILFVEDEIDLGNVIKQYLELNNLTIEWKTNGEEAKNYIDKHVSDIDLAIIDISLPELNGFELAKHINTITTEMPYIFLTARKEKVDKITGLKLGAVDYITKPFDIDELIVRIENILRRNHKSQPESKTVSTPSNFTLNNVSFVKEQLLLKINGKEITLTLREAELLEFLFKHKNKILKREVILTELWGKNDYFLGRSLDVFISRLRKYFTACESVQISNVYGIGYIFKTSEESE
ncbi:MAG: DNA-binding response regulator [Pseudopedobacter saltans]|uniref:DNA-binding response regulator n=1 Tax=Pseudopedobacter saltans TaxID=151895 RepID=A0A2W5FDH4_9SPHI|nr:MAG: DNA-binding response regulator [Pseudopedobacter saltans]